MRLFFALSLLFALCIPSFAAPAPFPRSVRPTPERDWCVGVWHRPGVSITFARDNGYVESWHGTDFTGHWWRDGEDVRATCHADGTNVSYSLLFQRDKDGVLVLRGWEVALCRD